MKKITLYKIYGILVLLIPLVVGAIGYYHYHRDAAIRGKVSIDPTLSQEDLLYVFVVMIFCFLLTIPLSLKSKNSKGIIKIAALVAAAGFLVVVCSTYGNYYLAKLVSEYLYPAHSAVMHSGEIPLLISAMLYLAIAIYVLVFAWVVYELNKKHVGGSIKNVIVLVIMSSLVGLGIYRIHYLVPDVMFVNTEVTEGQDLIVTTKLISYPINVNKYLVDEIDHLAFEKCGRRSVMRIDKAATKVYLGDWISHSDLRLVKNDGQTVNIGYVEDKAYYPSNKWDNTGHYDFAVSLANQLGVKLETNECSAIVNWEPNTRLDELVD